MTALTTDLDEADELLTVRYGDDPQPLGRVQCHDGRVDLSDVRRLLGRLETRAYQHGHQAGTAAAAVALGEGEAA